MKCRHCQKGLVNRPRGLCWACFYTPGVRELYGFKPKPTPEQVKMMFEATDRAAALRELKPPSGQ